MFILVTSAEIDSQKEMRTKEYIKTRDWVLDNLSDHNIVWLECFSDNEPQYLQKKILCYCSKFINKNYNNKGSKLGTSMKDFFNNYKVNDDITVQFTGRYHFLDTYFFDTVLKNPGYDLYVKNDGNSQYFTGCFAMKTNHLIQWVNETDWDYLNYSMINIEKSLWDYCKNKKLKFYEIDTMKMDCNIFGDGNLNRCYI